MRLQNKVALVTGGASGIGQGIVEMFAGEGAAVALVDINGEAARSLAHRLSNRSRVLPIEGDVAVDGQARAAVEQTVREFGGLDVLVNNAGIEVMGTVEQVEPEQWRRQIAVNLNAVYLFSHYAIPHLRARGGGVILHIASVHSFVGYPGTVAYDASKAALLGLTRAMALDHGRDGIRVNAVCPGYTMTPLLEQWLATTADPEQTMREVLKFHPLGRIGTPLDIAQACLFLASDAASFVTGTSLVVDGGMIAAGH